MSEFDKRLETHLVKEGWYRERPSLSSGRWMGRGILSFVAGMPLLFVGLFLPSSGVVLLSIALIVSAVALMPIAGAMPVRTQSGAVIRAMLEAYRRTLEKTMALARSMGQVVTESAIPLIETPDDAVAWGVALGLQDEVEQVLARSSEDVRAGGTGYYMPAWYLAGGGADGADGRGRRLGAGPHEQLAHPGLRRDDVGARHHRELAGVVGLRLERRRRGRVLGR